MEITYRTGKYYSEEHGEYHIIETVCGGRVIGELYADITTGQIMQIDVDKNFRRQGIASEMYKFAESKFGIFHSPDEHCTPEGMAFKCAVGGVDIDPELAYQPGY